MSEMLYHIKGLCPRCNFCISLWPAWRDEVARWGKTQTDINTGIKNMGRAWLDGCGYNSIFDPDNSGFDRDERKPPGPNARPMYEPNSALRVQWGEWGPEHITVPGDACGLDLDWDNFGAPRGGKVLVPHNVDSIAQAHLLLVVFTWFADCLILERECRKIPA